MLLLQDSITQLTENKTKQIKAVGEHLEHFQLKGAG